MPYRCLSQNVILSEPICTLQMNFASSGQFSFWESSTHAVVVSFQSYFFKMWKRKQCLKICMIYPLHAIEMYLTVELVSKTLKNDLSDIIDGLSGVNAVHLPFCLIILNHWHGCIDKCLEPLTNTFYVVIRTT